METMIVRYKKRKDKFKIIVGELKTLFLAIYRKCRGESTIKSGGMDKYINKLDQMTFREHSTQHF